MLFSTIVSCGMSTWLLNEHCIVLWNTVCLDQSSRAITYSNNKMCFSASTELWCYTNVFIVIIKQSGFIAQVSLP